MSSKMAPDDPRHGTPNGYINLGCHCEECKRANRLRGIQTRKKAEGEGLPAGDPRHGTHSGYRYFRCDCDLCVEAGKRYLADLAEQGLPPGDKRHGTLTGYVSHGCGCDECVEANRVYREEKRRAQESLDLLSSPPDEQPEEGSPSGHGQYGRLDDDGAKVKCHECGARFRSLPKHLGTHQMSAAEYRIRHGLPSGLPLNAASTSTRMRQAKNANAPRRHEAEGASE